MPNMNLKKTAMPEQEASARATNFTEVALGYEEAMALEEASRCLDCKHRPCVAGCPVNVQIPEFIELVKKGDFLGAYAKIRETNSLPAICGFAGGVLGGVWSDQLLRSGSSLTRARKVPVITGMLVSLAILGCNYVDSPAMVLVFMSIAFFGKGIGALGWAVMADVAPRQLAGLSGGIFNTFGNLSSIVTPIVIGAIVQFTGSFDMALVFVAANALLAVFSFLFVIGQIRRIEIAPVATPSFTNTSTPGSPS